MKVSRYVLSNQGILAVAAILVNIAAAVGFVGIGIEIQHPQELFSTLSPLRTELLSYVIDGVMGEIPSVAGTLQSFALAIAYGLTPLVVISLFAARAFVSSHAPEKSIPG